MTPNEQRYDLALSFWTVSFQYLTLAKNVSRETVFHHNDWVMSKNSKAGDITEEEYEETTRWSDHAIIIPLLCNLLHGIELLVKGFLLVDPNESIKKAHNIIDLCERFKKKYPEECHLIQFFDKYTDTKSIPDFLKHFLTDNNLQLNEMYQAFRYPSPDFSTMRLYSALKYRGEEGTTFFSELDKDIKKARIEAVRLGRGLETKK